MITEAINPNELRVGDIVHAVCTSQLTVGRTQLYSNVKLISVKEDAVESDGLLFRPEHTNFFLVKRAKQPLPKSIGSVVEVDGVKYIRVLEDSEWYYEWVKSEDTNHFDSVSSEYLSDLDYTVV